MVLVNLLVVVDAVAPAAAPVAANVSLDILLRFRRGWLGRLSVSAALRWRRRGLRVDARRVDEGSAAASVKDMVEGVTRWEWDGM